ncbi:leucine-rich repeat domain-containing protein [Lignipirellula cremea]|uniref:Leucine Rich repeats (2 copies) n=1 Tax=Lignipirellula cremea TaxID=2528010 RepID=A0A518E4H6_9BACT|nr:hypothetical protein [Lignipirellula cremea]QDU98980.1 Leucine Rich repeats (2 copies) [Lignipirellula cremea]
MTMLLRILAAGTFVLAITLAITAPVVADERAAADALRQRGAVVQLDDEGFVVSFRCREGGRLTLDDFRTVGGFRRVKTLSLSGGRTLGDEHLALLAGLEKLERVTLDGMMLTDDGLRHLAGWKSLRKLTFYNVTNRGKFTGSGMAHLVELPQLEQFACGGSSFDDAGLEACSRLTHLTDLQIWHTPVTDAGVVHLKRLAGLRNLRLLSQWRPRITDASLSHLAAIRSLETLSIGETRFSWSGGLNRLVELPNLKSLELYEVDMSAEDLNRVKAALTNVRVDWTPIREKYREMFERNFRTSPGVPAGAGDSR